VPEDLDRIRDVAANFQLFQGLRVIPVGLFCVAVGARWLELWSPGPWDKALLGIGPLAILAGHWWIDRYYRRTFGSVEPTPAGRGANVATGVAATGVTLALILAVVAILYGERLLGALDRVFPPQRLPVDLDFLVMAVGLAAGSRWVRGLWPFAALTLGMAFLPALGVRGPELGALFLVAMGTLAIVMGTLWHLRLARALKPLPADAAESSEKA
jgi:hypothetical protein